MLLPVPYVHTEKTVLVLLNTSQQPIQSHHDIIWLLSGAIEGATLSQQGHLQQDQ